MKVPPIIIEIIAAIIIALLAWVAFLGYKAGRIEEKVHHIEERVKDASKESKRGL